MKEAQIIDDLDLDGIPENSIHCYWMNLCTDGMNQYQRIPVLVAKGSSNYPVFGLTAAVHGNELNGIFVIQKLFREINVENLNGIIIGIPVVNVPSFHSKVRRFTNNVDLNHIMPGKEQGNTSQVYAHRFFNKIITKLDFLIDLHTASNGRINSYYVRADMKHPVVRKLALLQNADIIVHNPPSDGTLRGAADEIDIPALTLEVGNPNRIQNAMIKSGIIGIHNALSFLDMIPEDEYEPNMNAVICKSSYWIYTDIGGLLSLEVELLDLVKEGDKIATIRDIFGNLLKEYFAPEKGIVIGKSVSPVNTSGGRILHLGIIKD